MKRIFSALLAAALITALAGCGASTGDGTGETGTTLAGGQNQPSSDREEVTVEQRVIFEEDGVRMTVTGMKEGFLGPEIQVLVENETGNNIAFTGGVFVVNGITVDSSAYIEVAAGKKTHDTIDFMNTTLKTAGIQEIATVSGVDTNIIDSDSFETLSKANFHLETSIAGTHTQPIDDSGDVIYQEAGVSVIAKSITGDSMGESVVLLVKNETGKNIIVEAENVSVNGYTVDAWMYDTVVKDTVRFCTLDILASSLEENEIQDVQTVTFTISAIDADSYNGIAQSGELEVHRAG